MKKKFKIQIFLKNKNALDIYLRSFLFLIQDNTEEPITEHELDEGSGNVLSIFDPFLNILYVAAKVIFLISRVYN